MVLENLEINPDALAEFNVPLAVKKGLLGRLQLSIPWRNLKTNPVIVKLIDVYLLIEPQYDYTEFDAKKAEATAKIQKQRMLENAEAMQSFREGEATGKS